MKPTYETNIIVLSDAIEQTFNANGESNECLYCINEYGIKASTNKNDAYIPSDKCVPVRMAYHIDDPTEDWVKYGSPITEIDFGNVLKYWPAEILEAKTGDQVTIEYPDFKIIAKIINNKEILTMRNEEVKDEVTEKVTNNEVETKETKKGKKLPKWAIAAMVGTATAVGIGIVSGIILKKKKASADESEEDAE